ncbi:MAG TPA: hypothetical protein VM537_02320, partial [Anaerolineae bacterium]|nr:hypothetical protein [Anaerolineae bacterium]
VRRYSGPPLPFRFIPSECRRTQRLGCTNHRFHSMFGQASFPHPDPLTNWVKQVVVRQLSGFGAIMAEIIITRRLTTQTP